jgi:D-tyrosyl-tRNA(Tyr) deacylase
MRAVIQRVLHASVSVEGQEVGRIGHGLAILLGIGHNDSARTCERMAEKMATLRIFGDDEGRFNRSLIDLGGQALLVSQFTLYADARRGRRPSFTGAALPDQAQPLVAQTADALRRLGVVVALGRFGATMQVALVNDGPVTILLDSDMLWPPRA